jgi:hypothetical protein
MILLVQDGVRGRGFPETETVVRVSDAWPAIYLYLYLSIYIYPALAWHARAAKIDQRVDPSGIAWYNRQAGMENGSMVVAPPENDSISKQKGRVVGCTASLLSPQIYCTYTDQNLECSTQRHKTLIICGINGMLILSLCIVTIAYQSV